MCVAAQYAIFAPDDHCHLRVRFVPYDAVNNVRTSILKHLDAALCNAVLARQDSEAVLQVEDALHRRLASAAGARVHATGESLRAPIAGMNHAERAFLALTSFARYTGSPNTPDARTLGRVLPPDAHRRARALGAAIRLGCDLSGRSGALLKHSRLETADGVIVLQADDGWADMLLGEQTAKRASALADQLDMGLRLGR